MDKYDDVVIEGLVSDLAAVNSYLDAALETSTRLETQRDDLLAALEFYANKGNWELEVNRYGEPNCAAYDDDGKIARDVIAKASEGA